MRNVWILLLTLTISTLFIHVPHKGAIGFVFNPDVTLSYNQYVWLLCQHLQMISLAAVIWDESRNWVFRTVEMRAMLTRIYSAYMWILVADGLMWILAYDDPLKGYRITWNIVKTIAFIGFVIYERWLPKRRI
jgi:hypothetical protein